MKIIIENESCQHRKYSENYKKLDSKYVYDSDGFLTEYTMYYNPYESNYFFMFGDTDLYDPDPNHADHICEDKITAYEWFNNYKGLEEAAINENLSPKFYVVTFEKNGNFHTNLVKGYSVEQVKQFFNRHKNNADILEVKLAKRHDNKPGIPVLDSTESKIYENVNYKKAKHRLKHTYEKSDNSRYNEDNAAILLKNIEEDISKAGLEFMMSPKIGFPEDEAKQYFNVSTEINDESVIVYVGAELSYQSLYDLSLVLNKVIARYDKEAYFDMEAPGRLIAYLYRINPNSKIRKVENSDKDIIGNKSSAPCFETNEFKR